jgi:hypothetical protein
MPKCGSTLVVLNSNFDTRADDPAAVLGCIMTSFQTVHRGFRIGRIVNEAHGHHNIEVVLTSRTFDICHTRSNIGGVSGFRSMVGSLTREQAADRKTPLLGMFVYTSPRVEFTEPEQELLLEALTGAPDKQLAARLGVPIGVVKSRWRRLLVRAFTAVPDVFHGVPAPRGDSRGLQIRHLLLEYVRHHPSELTPYAWSRRGPADDLARGCLSSLPPIS